MLAAVEIYNKPNFAYREESFAILAVNAWELLLKARILQLDRNRVAALLEYERRKRADGAQSVMLYRKKNRAGNHVSVGLIRAFDRLTNDYSDKIHTAVRVNLEALVEVRDNAVHFFNNNLDLALAIQEIGAATLKNYLNCVRQWFAVDLTKYNVFLMPLAFARESDDATLLNAQERHLLRYLEQIRGMEDDVANDFNAALRIEFSVRKTKDATAPRFVLSNAPDAIPVKLDEEDIREKYPWDYDILTRQLQKRYTDFKSNNQYHALRRPLESNVLYCRERLLDPGNPKSARKKFYSQSIVREFDEQYTRAKPLTPDNRGAA